MTLFSRQELQTLTGDFAESSPLVSIYLSTHEAGSEIQQDPIRLKNQLSAAGTQLEQKGLDEKARQALLKPAADLIENQSFWQNQKGGLAIFLGPNQFQHYVVPLAVETCVFVGNRFHIRPLLPIVTDNSSFYILAASQGQVALYQATRDSIHSVDLGSTPRSLEVALRYDDPSESLQGHGTGRSGDRTIVHGQGSGKDDENTDILRFFQLVSDGVEKILAGQTVPLVFVGVDFLFPIYQQANKYPHLMAEAVAHQPDQLSPEEIRDRALKIVEPRFNASRVEEHDRYGSLKNNNQATEDIAQIVNAAYNGQIETLFITQNSSAWGTFDPESRRVTYHNNQQADSEDLIGLVVEKALSIDAKVHVVDANDMPANSTAAATLRYPIMLETEAVTV